MQVYFSVKQLGKKDPLITGKAIDIPLSEPTLSLRKLIEAVVRDQVDTYNRKERDDPDEDSPLKSEQPVPLLSTGKIAFGKIYNEKKAGVNGAINNALQSFEDGLYLVFYGDRELTSLEEKVDISEGGIFRFVRLVFLSGGYF